MGWGSVSLEPTYRLRSGWISINPGRLQAEVELMNMVGTGLTQAALYTLMPDFGQSRQAEIGH